MGSIPRTAFVHIGAPKTGTTAIQAAFASRKAQVAAAGFHYLDGGRNHSERLAVAFWDAEDARRLGKFRWIDDPAEFSAYRARVREELHDELERHSSHHLIISGEELCAFSPGEAARFLDFLRPIFEDIRIIAYARDPQDWITSAAQQGTKWSGDLLETAFAAPRLPMYQNRFQPYREAVGDGSFDLRVFRAPASGFDVVTDFAQAVGLKDAELSGAAHENRAVSHRTTMVYSALNAWQPPFVDWHHNPFRAFRLIEDARLPGRAFTLPRETVEAALPALRQEVDWVQSVARTVKFEATKLPEIGYDDWFGGETDQIISFAETLARNCGQAQNELALKSFLRAKACRRSDPGLAARLLSDAALLATDRWTLHLIAQEAVEIEHPDRKKFFAKQRLMRRLEDPEPADPEVGVGNPFDRAWLLPNAGGEVAGAIKVA